MKRILETSAAFPITHLWREMLAHDCTSRPDDFIGGAEPFDWKKGRHSTATYASRLVGGRPIHLCRRWPIDLVLGSCLHS